MRGIAAIAVMLTHAQGKFSGIEGFSRAYLLVDFFFLLSGFVLGLAADPQLRAGMGCERFMRARWRRLWPMIAIGALLGALSFAEVGANGLTVLAESAEA